MDEETLQLKRRRSSMSATPSTTTTRKGVNGSKRKRVRTSVYETAASTAADGMAMLGEQIKAALKSAPETKFDQCLKIMNEMLNDSIISAESYFNISRALMDNERYAAMFSGMVPELRMEWLRQEGLVKELE